MSIPSSTVNKSIYIARIVFEFYPIEGGSVTHIKELSKKIDPYLKSQVIIAPESNIDCTTFDNNFGVKIIRIKYYQCRKIWKIPTVPLIHLLYSMSVYFKFKKIERPDIIHAHGIGNISYCTIIGKLLNVPVVGMVHGSTIAYSRKSGLYESILATLFKPDTALILDDGSIAPMKFKKIWKNRVTIVFHGIDTETFRPIADRKKLFEELRLKELHSINPLAYLILSTSSLIPVKNLDLLIKSFKLLIERYGINTHLLIAGEGDSKDSLIHLTEKLGIETNVTFLGDVRNDQIVKYLSISNVVAATSLYSNMNRSIQEAMACEKPVIVFDTGRIRELITHMENGILVTPGDLESFAEKLNLLYQNKKLSEELGKKARETILTERNWQKRIFQELEVYHKLLNRY